MTLCGVRPSEGVTLDGGLEILKRKNILCFFAAYTSNEAQRTVLRIWATLFTEKIRNTELRIRNSCDEYHLRRFKEGGLCTKYREI